MTNLDQLQLENEQLRQRLEEAEATLRALRSGEVDAVVVDGENEQILTLEAADRPYRLLVQQVPQAAATLTPEGAIIYCNERFAEMLGRPLTALVHQPFLDFVAPKSRPRIEPLLTGQPSPEVQMEVTLQRGDGTSVTVYLGFMSLTEGALGVCTLVTDHTQHQHYQELRSTQEALRAVSERLELAQQAGRIGTFEWDLRTGVVIWSATQEKLLGLAPGEFGGRYEDWKGYVHSDDFECTEAAVLRAVAERGQFDNEFRIVRPSGEIRWIAGSGKVQCDDDGEPIRFVGVNIDITDRKEVLQELEQAGAKKDEFLATLAHELRNPLAPISNAVALLEQAGLPNSQLRWCSGVIHRQVQVMARLLEDLLDISRISRVRLELRKARVDLASVLEAAVDTSHPVIDAGGHELVIDLPSEPIHLHADSVRLAQVFSNLLNNAAKYTEPGGHIRVNAERHNQQVIVSVEDSGIGISPDMVPHLFEIFSQVRSTSAASQEGLGIGLSLVKGLVELHGGRVTAFSEGLGQGSVFQVHLPTLAGGASEEAPEYGEASESPRLAQHRILMVDDNRDSADSLARLIGTRGHDVRTAYDGLQSIEIASSFHPEVILLDIGMPLIDGHEVCRRIRQQPWGRDIFMIAVTGWGQAEDRRRTAEAGFDVHLVKPVNAGRLMKLLDDHFAEARAK